MSHHMYPQLSTFSYANTFMNKWANESVTVCDFVCVGLKSLTSIAAVMNVCNMCACQQQCMKASFNIIH